MPHWFIPSSPHRPKDARPEVLLPVRQTRARRAPDAFFAPGGVAPDCGCKIWGRGRRTGAVSEKMVVPLQVGFVTAKMNRRHSPGLSRAGLLRWEISCV